MNNFPMTVSQSAIGRIKELLLKREKPSYGIRIGLKTKGCSGLSYAIEYVDEKFEGDEELVIEDIHILVDPKAVLYIIGTEMDYQETDVKAGFTFLNPNEKGRCGCGKSFHV
ncbi:MAG: iron-sulfur cluster assembly accessory protein [Proteobacteria bacterium]|nr:iron-sulfur cluster assembly accessory protein [Pseudomonadota bacterium]